MIALTISLEPSDGNGAQGSTPRAEHETVGRLKIVANGSCTTEGMDLHRHAIEEGPLVSGYPMAEWLAWNWWRLCWEAPTRGASYRPSYSWFLSHTLTTIGSGDCWPDITITSDGFTTELTCRPWSDTTHATFRYLGRDRTEVVPREAFERAIEGFIEAVLARLDEARVPTGNLGALWEELQAERNCEKTARFRRMEARIGSDPDEHDEDEINSLLTRAAALGEEAFEELASDPFVRTMGNGALLRTRQIEDTAARLGFDARPLSANMPETPAPRGISVGRGGEDR